MAKMEHLTIPADARAYPISPNGDVQRWCSGGHYADPDTFPIDRSTLTGKARYCRDCRRKNDARRGRFKTTRAVRRREVRNGELWLGCTTCDTFLPADDGFTRKGKTKLGSQLWHGQCKECRRPLAKEQNRKYRRDKTKRPTRRAMHNRWYAKRAEESRDYRERWQAVVKQRLDTLVELGYPLAVLARAAEVTSETLRRWRDPDNTKLPNRSTLDRAAVVFDRLLAKSEAGIVYQKRPPMSDVCTVEGCDRPEHRRNLCQAHYRRLMQYGDPLAGRRSRCGLPTNAPTACTVAKCTCKLYARGMCHSHYRRWQKGQVAQ